MEEEGDPPAAKRGRYKNYLIHVDAEIPRQTRHSWRRDNIDIDNVNVDNGIHAMLHEDEGGMEGEDNGIAIGRLDHGGVRYGDQAAVGEPLLNEESDDDLSISGNSDLSNEGGIGYGDQAAVGEPLLNEESDDDLSISGNSDLSNEEDLGYGYQAVVGEPLLNEEADDDSSISGDSDSSNENNIQGEEMPLLPGADINQEQAILLITTYVLRHNLTGAALQDLLIMLNELVPGVVPATKFLFHKSFSNIRGKIECHYYCQSCYVYIGTDEHQQNCPNPTCQAEFLAVSNKKNGSFLLYIPIESQLRDLLENRDIVTCIIDKNEREHNDDIQDIFDGIQMQKLIREGKLGANDLTLVWNCDGVPVFNSSGFSIWPVQVTINELPPEMRKKHVLFNALWFGPKKPEMDTLFTPIVEEAKKLADEGFTWLHPENGEVKHSRVFFLTSACDSVARPCLRHCMQFNGQFGCDWCLHPGETCEKGAGRVRVYPYSIPEPESRTQEGWEDDAITATPGNPVNGVKGPSKLLFLPLFNIVQGFVPDYMHCVLLGVVRQFMKLWLDSSNHGKDWYLGLTIDTLDNRILGMKPPREISRAPRSLTTRSFWKATEWKSFLLYYSPFVLLGLLPNKHYKHWCLFVFSLHSLLQSKVSRSMIEKSDLALKKFVIGVETLYGKEHVSFNIHLLTHLAAAVNDWGPLWASSAFPFEANNGRLLKYFHGTQHVAEQICSSFVLWRSIPKCLQHMHYAPLSVQNYVQRLWHCSSVLPKSITKLGNFILIGRGVEDEISMRLRAALWQLFGRHIHCRKAQYYSRVLIGRCMLCVEAYTRSKRRNDYVIQFKDGSYGIIKNLVVLKSNCSCAIDACCVCQKSLIIFYSLLNKQNSCVFQDNQIQISSSRLIDEVSVIRETKAISANEFERKCIIVHQGRKTFVVPIVNTMESD